MNTKVKIISTNNEVKIVQLVKVGTSYLATGADALLVSNCLKITFRSKKVSGRAFHSTTFHEKHFECYQQTLQLKGITVSVVPLA